MYAADLHIHTDVSDCSMNAEEILKLALDKGITHLAFTDHDTTDCAGEHLKLAEKYGIRAIPGVEMSAYDYKKKKKVHILGYGYQTNRQIEAIGRETLKKRTENCLKQIEILNTLGYHVPEEEAARMGRTGVYKQHILDYLVKTGQEETMFGEVYHNIFKNNGPCDFDITYPAAEDVIQAIKADKGSAVLAHPGQQNNYSSIHRLTEAGLDGIELNHPSHRKNDRIRVEEYCRTYQLIMTGGSDFHGSYEKTRTELGGFPAHKSSEILFLS
ncbi:PHP domain-containing protein [Faecalicatena orotica]|uniref:Polymerase/histidinol phosphatase N-terminal domain-containing protein n=1 Tax=Faecalicatena orotica TaxID=1544 RepID=A0A2Y9BE24_9FIRM|nr:PHP domain-containing protein [Faecalicatena orotica]PWJ29976.1 hypothetical protein A8806_105279 [Faecalicatena orotica]SSA55702.1 hypothetical protein SAMN05216536_105279 [Faecalicatena orotica]